MARMLQESSRRMRDLSLAWEVPIRREEYGDILLEGFRVRRDPDILYVQEATTGKALMTSNLLSKDLIDFLFQSLQGKTKRRKTISSN